MPFADGADEGLGQDVDLARRGKPIATAAVVKRQRVGHVVLGQETLHGKAELLVVFEEESQAAGSQAVMLGEDRSQLLPPARQPAPRWPEPQSQRSRNEPDGRVV